MKSNKSDTIVLVITIAILLSIPIIVRVAYVRWPGGRVPSVIVQPYLENMVIAEVIGVSDDIVYIRLTNSSMYLLEFSGGRYFKLEHFTFMAWRSAPIRLGVDFTLALDSIIPEASIQRGLGLTIYRRTLVPGRRYRARIEVFRETYDPTYCDSNRHTVIVEFSI